MPPKPVSQAKLPDVKVRKITDFWTKSDAGSSPVRPQAGASQRGSTSSPTRKNATNASTPISKAMSGSLLFPGGKVSPAKGLAMNNVGSSLNSPSPRKYIVISDDDDDVAQDSKSKMSVSKKRPRETPPPDSIAARHALAIYQSTPERSASPPIDLTGSPPKKRRLTESLSHSRTTSSALSANSSHIEFSPITPLSPRDSPSESLDVTMASNGASASFTHSTTMPFSNPDTSMASNLPSTVLSDPPKQAPEDKARSRIEEIRRIAEAREKAAQVQTTISYNPMMLDESDEDDDILEKLITIKKPPVAAIPKKASGSGKVAADPFGSTSPLTEVESDSDSDKGSFLPRVMTRSMSRAASQAPEDPPLTKPRSRAPSKAPTRASSKAPTRMPASRSRASSKAPTLPPPPARTKPVAKTMPSHSMIPSSLASLLADSHSSSRRRDDPTTVAFMRDVKRDMQEIEQRRLYGGAIEPEPPEQSRSIDPSVTAMALGEEDGRKMNEVIASDRTAATQVSLWRPLWDEQLVGARDITMDIGYQIPRLTLSQDPHPILARLSKLVSSTDTPHLALFLSSGILSIIPSGNEDRSLVSWLFRLACEAPENVANAAQQALHAKLTSPANPSEHQISFPQLMDRVLALGPLREAIAPLVHSDVAISPPRDPITRNCVVTRLVGTIKVASGMISQNTEDLTVLLLLIYLDPSTSIEVRRDISLMIEDLIVVIAGTPDSREQEKELIICKKIVEFTSTFRLAEKRMVLNCIFGGQHASRRLMRWIAVGFLLPGMVQALDWTTYLQPPLLSPFAEMLTPSLMSKSPFRISSKTNYHDLHHRVDMLGTVLTDIRLYSAKEDSNIERIMTGLDHLHSKIVDARAISIDRTRAKDALQRLRLRVHFQFQRTIKPTATIKTLLNR